MKFDIYFGKENIFDVHFFSKFIPKTISFDHFELVWFDFFFISFFHSSWFFGLVIKFKDHFWHIEYVCVHLMRFLFFFLFFESKSYFKWLKFSLIIYRAWNGLVCQKLLTQKKRKKLTFSIRFICLFVRCLPLERISTKWSHADLFIRYGFDWTHH